MDVRGKRVLILGDSLSHRGGSSSPVVYDVREGTQRTSSVPGDLLASYFLEAGASAVRVNAKVSRSAWNFFRVEDGAALLRADQAWKPNIVIVFLGTNDLGLNMTKDAEAMNTIFKAYASVGADVGAVGPPSFASSERMAQTEGVLQMLKSVFGANHVIDARPLTADLTVSGRSGDGVHFVASGAKLFAARMAQALRLNVSPNLPSTVTPTIPETSQPRQMDWNPFVVGLSTGIIAIGLAILFRKIKNRRLTDQSSTSGV